MQPARSGTHPNDSSKTISATAQKKHTEKGGSQCNGGGQSDRSEECVVTPALASLSGSGV